MARHGTNADRTPVGKRYVYLWADGLHVNVRLDEERSCILVIMAAEEHGNKELVAVSDGYGESTASWREILLDLRRRGLLTGARLATADGALGFWKALRGVYPGTKEQICWFHKSGNVLDKMPKSVQSKATTMIREMWQAQRAAIRCTDSVPPDGRYRYQNGPIRRWRRAISGRPAITLWMAGGRSAINPIHATSSLSSVQVSSNAAPAALLPMGAE